MHFYTSAKKHSLKSSTEKKGDPEVTDIITQVKTPKHIPLKKRLSSNNVFFLKKHCSLQKYIFYLRKTVCFEGKRL